VRTDPAGGSRHRPDATVTSTVMVTSACGASAQSKLSRSTTHPPAAAAERLTPLGSVTWVRALTSGLPVLRTRTVSR
jgi:hypothetical protein